MKNTNIAPTKYHIDISIHTIPFLKTHTKNKEKAGIPERALLSGVLAFFMLKLYHGKAKRSTGELDKNFVDMPKYFCKIYIKHTKTSAGKDAEIPSGESFMKRMK